MVSISKNLGSYNWIGPAEKQWNLILRLPDDAPVKSMSVCFPEDDEPDIENLPPSEVAELIAERNRRFLISSDREKIQLAAKWCEENADRIDREWAEAEIQRIDKRIDTLQERRGQLTRCYCEPEALE